MTVIEAEVWQVNSTPNLERKLRTFYSNCGDVYLLDVRKFYHCQKDSYALSHPQQISPPLSTPLSTKCTFIHLPLLRLIRVSPPTSFHLGLTILPPPSPPSNQQNLPQGFILSSLATFRLPFLTLLRLLLHEPYHHRRPERRCAVR